MEHYLLTARSVTHAQQMARILEQSGIFVPVRRAGAGLTGTGCGYTLQIDSRHYASAMKLLAQAGKRPIRVFRVSESGTNEVAT